MPVRLRLRRTGAKNKACFRIVAADGRSPRDGRFIERLGFYDPRHQNEEINLERAEYWVKNGAQPSETVAAIIRRAKDPKVDSIAGKHPEKEAEPRIEQTQEKETQLVEDTDSNQASESKEERSTETAKAEKSHENNQEQEKKSPSEIEGGSEKVLSDETSIETEETAEPEKKLSENGLAKKESEKKPISKEEESNKSGEVESVVEKNTSPENSEETKEEK